MTAWLSSVARDNDRNFVNTRKVPAAPTTVLIRCKLNRDIFTVVFLDPIIVADTYPQIPPPGVRIFKHTAEVFKCRIMLHPMFEGLTWVVDSIQLSVYRTFSVTWKEETELMTQLTMDTECKRTSHSL